MLQMQAPVVMTTIDNGRLTWRRGNDSAHPPPMGSIEQRLQSVAHQTCAFQQATDEQMRVRVWAIHEPHWKREILRTEPTAGI